MTTSARLHRRTCAFRRQDVGDYDTYSESAARDQAARYLDDVKRKFKDDDRAKKCKQKDGYPDFTPVGETYTACQS